MFQKIKLKENIKNVRMDVGTSVCAPNSAYEGEKSQSECFSEFHSYMTSNGFKLYYKSGTDASYVNENLLSYIIQNNIVNDCLEFQNGCNYLF